MAKKLRSKKSLLKHVLYVVLVPLELCVLRDIVSRTFLSLYDLLPFFRGSRVSSLCSRWSRALGASHPTCSHTLLAPCPAYSYFWYSVYLELPLTNSSVCWILSIILYSIFALPRVSCFHFELRREVNSDIKESLLVI